VLGQDRAIRQPPSFCRELKRRPLRAWNSHALCASILLAKHASVPIELDAVD